MAADPDDVAVLVSAIRELKPAWVGWPGGWPGEAEAALIDAVLSIRASYGQRHNGVRGAVGRWRAHNGDARLDDLNRLAATLPERLAATLGNQQKLSGRPLKAQAITEAAGNLVAGGVQCAADVDPLSGSQKQAYRAVWGLGPVTWEYFLMLLGTPGVKADTWIVRYVEASLGRSASSSETRKLMVAAADELGVSASTLDHTVWNHMRR